MKEITNSVLFYGGIGIIIFLLVAFVVYTIISRIGMKHLKAKLDVEYGPQTGE